MFNSTEAIGPAGEWLRYIIRNSGDTSNPAAFDPMELFQSVSSTDLWVN